MEGTRSIVSLRVVLKVDDVIIDPTDTSKKNFDSSGAVKTVSSFNQYKN